MSVGRTTGDTGSQLERPFMQADASLNTFFIACKIYGLCKVGVEKKRFRPLLGNYRLMDLWGLGLLSVWFSFITICLTSSLSEEFLSINKLNIWLS